jgi:hypothetical protein
MSPGSEAGMEFQPIGRRWKSSRSARLSLREELTQAQPPMLDQTSWNRHELLKGWALSGKNPAPYY